MDLEGMTQELVQVLRTGTGSPVYPFRSQPTAGTIEVGPVQSIDYSNTFTLCKLTLPITIIEDGSKTDDSRRKVYRHLSPADPTSLVAVLRANKSGQYFAALRIVSAGDVRQVGPEGSNLIGADVVVEMTSTNFVPEGS